MFIKIFKWIGIILGSFVSVVVLILGALYGVGNARLVKKYKVQPEMIQLPTDQASIQRGDKWAAVLCADCHGDDFSGKPLLEDQVMGYVSAPNLTAGEGGAGREFSDQDWVLALRHGIDPEGRALIGMPSMNFAFMSEKDLGETIAYLKTVASVDHEMGEPGFSFPGKVLLAAGGFGRHILPAEMINHSQPAPAAVAANASVEYGSYLVRIIGCRDCHGEDLTGGKSPEPNAPPAPDITSRGVIGTWPLETFIATVRTQDGQGMPWVVLKPLDDSELKAIHLYLQSLQSD